VTFLGMPPDLWLVEPAPLPPPVPEKTERGGWGKRQRQVMKLAKSLGRPVRAEDLDFLNARKVLADLAAAGRLRRVDRGAYEAVPAHA